MKMKDFEGSLKQLEEIVLQLEGGDLTLDKALALFEEGIKISRYCSSKLEEAERKVETLIKDADGSLVESPFASDEEEA
ncbi:MAG: xseB [Acidobacteria bacterium]|jgi:exodeoxyribonuclease VII small subunit|nr:xseB [Acidobacteriota bacterium]